MYSTLIMVVSQGLIFPSRFRAKFEDSPRKIREFPPSIFYLRTALFINRFNDGFCIRYKSGPICTPSLQCMRVEVSAICIG